MKIEKRALRFVALFAFKSLNSNACVCVCVCVCMRAGMHACVSDMFVYPCLSKLQARQIFAAYLESLQVRLLKETR